MCVLGRAFLAHSSVEPPTAAASFNVTHHYTTTTTTHTPSPLHPKDAPPAPAMSSILGRTAFRAAPRLRPTQVPRRWNTSTSGVEDRQAGRDAIKAGAKRDPELYVRLPA